MFIETLTDNNQQRLACFKTFAAKNLDLLDYYQLVICIADDVVRFLQGGFEDGLSGHLLKCSLISDLNDFL